MSFPIHIRRVNIYFHKKEEETNKENGFSVELWWWVTKMVKWIESVGNMEVDCGFTAFCLNASSSCGIFLITMTMKIKYNFQS